MTAIMISSLNPEWFQFQTLQTAQLTLIGQSHISEASTKQPISLLVTRTEQTMSGLGLILFDILSTKYCQHYKLQKINIKAISTLNHYQCQRIRTLQTITNNSLRKHWQQYSASIVFWCVGVRWTGTADVGDRCGATTNTAGHSVVRKSPHQYHGVSGINGIVVLLCQRY